jgi:hypothetical protein
MPSTSVTLFKGGVVPDYIVAASAQNANIVLAPRAPMLSYKGKVWTINIDGKETLVTKRDENGEEVPLPIMRVVVLDYAKHRGRAYYAGAYDPQAVRSPDCWSDDGITPSAKIAQPVSPKCEGCPKAAKGSKVTDQNKAVVACSLHRFLAVVPANDLEFPAMRLKIAITSDWDGRNEMEANKGWFGFMNYMKFLNQHNIGHTAMCVTRMKFDPASSFVKVLFAHADWVPQDKLPGLLERAKSEEVQNLLTSPWEVNAPAAGAAMPPDEEETELPAQAQPVQGRAAQAQPAPEPDEDEETAQAPPTAPEPDEDEDAEVKALKARKAKERSDKAAAAQAAQAAAQAAAARKAAPVDDDDNPPPVKSPAKKSNTAPKGTPAAAPVAAPPAVGVILTDWDDDQ